MKFAAAEIQGAWIIEPELQEDERGFFARTFCAQEFEAYGLISRLVQCSISYNRRTGTLRGLHYQAKPHEETKLVHCMRGAIFDVIVDLRPDSRTFRKWTSVELSNRNHRLLYIPEGCAHGFQTLEDDTEVFYQMSESYHPESARGLQWNDPTLSIPWPMPNAILSNRDRSFQGFGTSS